MSGDSSEEKNLPASSKKLREARKKGQIAKGPDLVSAVVTTALIAYAWGGAGWIDDQFQALFATAGQATALDFGDAVRLLAPAAAQTLAMIAGPALAAAVLSVVLASMLVNKGFVFALEPLTPKLSNVSPLSGFKKLFGVKTVVELVKSLVKAALLGGTLVQLWRGGVGTVVGVPGCGTGCIGPVLSSMLRPLVGAALAMYLAGGLLDLLLQQWLFLREMKMTLTEMKRETKDTNGNPHVRAAQRRVRQELSQDGPKIGFRHATLLVCAPGSAVGLHFVRGKTPLPAVVCRGSGPRAAELIAAARAGCIPLFWDKALAVDLGGSVPVGRPITAQFFQRVTTALFASGAVR